MGRLWDCCWDLLFIMRHSYLFLYKDIVYYLSIYIYIVVVFENRALSCYTLCLNVSVAKQGNKFEGVRDVVKRFRRADRQSEKMGERGDS